MAARQACISSAAATIDFPAGFQQLVWRLDRDALVRKFVALTGHPVVRAIEFSNVLALDNDPGQGLLSILRCMLADVQRLVKNNPGVALLSAAALGFLLARTFSRD